MLVACNANVVGSVVWQVGRAWRHACQAQDEYSTCCWRAAFFTWFHVRIAVSFYFIFFYNFFSSVCGVFPVAVVRVTVMADFFVKKLECYICMIGFKQGRFTVVDASRPLLLVCSWFYFNYFYCSAETCPSGWQRGYNETVCLSLVTNSSIWSDSENACKAKGGQLASLNTLDQFYYVEAICGAGTSDGCWIGGQEVGSYLTYYRPFMWQSCNFNASYSPFEWCSYLTSWSCSPSKWFFDSLHFLTAPLEVLPIALIFYPKTSGFHPLDYEFYY